ETHSVREFIEIAFSHIGRTITWKGEGMGEVGIDSATGKAIIEVDPRYFRPTEVDLLIGDPSHAEQTLGWKHKTRFTELVKEMVEADLRRVRKDGRAHHE
ncbi:MAG: GDP-mannose 4,6-dehydratase, partial [Pseudomonadota bacterium]